MLSEANALEFHLDSKIRYGWYTIRNFDPINALTLKK